MELTRKFSQLNKGDSLIAGGKGASLGEMMNAGIPVPDGFVVLSTTFDEFLHKAGLLQEIDAILDAVDHKAVHSIDGASEQIQGLIKHANMPADIAADIETQFAALDSEFVAVRSSATAEDGADHAWAGQLDSYLNTTKDTLLEKVQHCWASLFTPRAIFYRFEKGLHTTKISVAVVVQKMVNSEVSGIAFSVHPVTEDRNQLIIEAGFGLGEAIVSGSVTPDSYVVEKEPRRIIDINVSNQTRAMYRKQGGGNEWINLDDAKAASQVLTEDEIHEFSNIIMTIERHYGFPCDIEWAFEAGKFYVVQSRPITTLTALVEDTSIKFIKEYTRDYTYMIEEGWYETVLNKFVRYGGPQNPNVPPVLFYMNDGVIEVWENTSATPWILDTLQVKIQAEPSFIPNMLDQHERELADIKQYWDKKFVTTKEELKDFMRKVYDYMYAFDFMYYSGVDERTPADLRARALKIRDVDSYFGTSDDMIRLSLQKIYPELKGLESTILFNEIDNPPAKEILQARKRASIMNGSELFVGSLSEYRALHNDYVFEIETPPADATTLVGQVGNKGYAKGVVRILKRKEQIDEAQEGDIIVSAMTTPEFVPAMKKAAAIITDEGGITCHAAIVARELNKPCVIGTKFATELLKDGDIVEVDADNGIVKIISTNDLLRDLRILNKDLWIEDGRWVQSPLIWSLFTHWSDASVVKRITENCDLGGIFTIDGYAFHDIKTFNNLNAYLEKLYKDEKLKDLALRTDAEGKILFKEIIDTLQKDDNYILNNFESLFKNYQEFIGFWTATTVIGNQISPLAKKMGVVSTEADLFEKVHPYLRESWIEEEVAAMRRIAEQYVEKYPDHSVPELVSRIDSDTELKDAIAVYLKKFSWARISKWSGDPIDMEYAQKRLAEEINNVVEKNYIDRTYKNNIDECDGLVAVSVNAAYYRAQATMLEMMMAERMHAIFTTVGKGNGLEFSNVLLLTPQELLKLVKNPNEKIANKDAVMERKNPFFCVVDVHGTETILTAKDKEYSIVYDLYIDTHKNDQTTELKGIGASKGKVTAKVRIINSAKEFENFKEGEILVAVETSPTFVPLMRMAAAILTGRGGITSHAAIVSRELNKPCIIAIKDITKILNDGDEVEVDANNGIVKILTKSTSLVDHLKG